MTAPVSGSSVTVQVLSDVSTFGRDTKKAIANSLKGITASIKVRPQVDVRDLGKLQARIQNNVKPKIKVQVELDQASLRALNAKITGAAGIQSAPKLQVMLTLASGARAKLQRELNNITPPLTVKVTPELGDLDARGLRGLGTTTVRAETDRASFADAIRNVASLSRAIGTLAVPAVAVGSIPSILGLGAALATAAQAAAILPGVMAAGGFAFGALQVGVMGFGEALKNVGDPEKFAEAIEGLSPAAREAAIAVRDLRPAFLDMKNVVQDQLFAGLGPQIAAIGNTYMPVLEESFKGITFSANETAHGIADMLLEGSRVQDIAQIGSDATNVFGELFGAVQPLAGAFLDAATVGSSFLPGLTSGATSAAQSFADMVARARETGQLKEFISEGLSAIGDLGQIAGNVGVTIGNIFSAGNLSGGGFLETLKSITGSIRDLTGSVAGQDALQSFFGVTATVAATLGDTLKAIAPSLATILDNAELAVNALAPAIAPLADMAGQILASMSPLLPVIGEVAAIIGGVLVNALSELMPGIRTLVDAFTNALRPVLPIISTALNQLVDALGPVVDIIAGLLADAIVMIVPVIGELAGIIGQTLSQAIQIITPVLPQLADAILGILDAILPVLPQLTQMASAILIQLLPAVVGLIPPLVEILVALTPLIPPLAELGLSLIPLMTQSLVLAVPALDALAAIISTVVVPIVEVLVVAINGTIGIITALVDSMTFLQGIAIGTFTAIGDITTAIWTNLVMPVLTGVKDFVSLILQPAFTVFRDVAGAAFTAFGGVIDSVVVGPIQGAFNKLREALGGVEKFFRGTVDFIGRTWKELEGVMKGPVNFFIDPIYENGIRKAWNTVTGIIPGSVPPDLPFVQKLRSGGPVLGQGSGDKMPALLEPGEYVIPKPVVGRWGLRNIQKMHAATIRGGFPGLEGMFSDPRDYMMPVQKFALGGLVGGQNVARAMNRKPYIWGGSSFAGTDCSGYMAMIYNGIKGMASPYHRDWTTASFPGVASSRGFSPGMHSQFSIGNVAGSHQRGTLAGINVESGGSHGYVSYGGPARGVPYGTNYSLAQVGGQFMPGGGGGGGSFLNPIEYLKKIFGPIQGIADGVIGRYGDGGTTQMVAKMPKALVDGAMDYLKDKIFDVLGLIAEVAEQIASKGLDAVKWVGNGALEIGGKALDKLGDLGGFLGDLNPLATGGITTGPTRALIGERGPEAIIPLSRLSGILQKALEGFAVRGMAGLWAREMGPMIPKTMAAGYNLRYNIPGLQSNDAVQYGRNPTSAMDWWRLVEAEARRRVENRIMEIKLELSNHGVLGSQMEVERWLRSALQDLIRNGALPEQLNQVLGGLR